MYWRTADFQRSLLEVGLDPRSGRFLSVTAGRFTLHLGADDAWLGLVVEGLGPKQLRELRAGIAPP